MKENRVPYEIPAIIVVDVKSKRVICQSPDALLQDYTWETIPIE